MKPSSFQTAIRLQFDCLVKRVIDTTVKDYQRELSERPTPVIREQLLEKLLPRPIYLNNDTPVWHGSPIRMGMVKIQWSFPKPSDCFLLK